MTSLNLNVANSTSLTDHNNNLSTISNDKPAKQLHGKSFLLTIFPNDLLSNVVSYLDKHDIRIFKCAGKTAFLALTEVETVSKIWFEVSSFNRNSKKEIETKLSFDVILRIYKNVRAITLTGLSHQFNQTLATNYPTILTEIKLICVTSIQKLLDFAKVIDRSSLRSLGIVMKIIEKIDENDAKQFIQVFQIFGQCTNLTTLKLKTDNSIEIPFELCKKLNEISLHQPSISKATVDSVSKCKHLTNLTIDSKKADACKKLLLEDLGLRFKRLDLQSAYSMGLSDSDFENSLDHLKDLESLSLPNELFRVDIFPGSDRSLRLIAQTCKKLEFFSFDFTKITNIGLEALAKNASQLRYLRAEEIQGVTSEGFLTFARNCTQLRALEMKGSTIDENGLMAIAANCPNLGFIDLMKGNHPKFEGFDRFLQACSNLKYCTPSYDSISNKNVQALEKKYSKIDFEGRTPFDEYVQMDKKAKDQHASESDVKEEEEITFD